MNNENTLAINGETIAMPDTVKAMSDNHGNLMTTKVFLQTINKLPINRKQKLTDLKKAIGDKAKTQIKEYNTAKLVRAGISRKVAALAAASPDMRHNAKFVFNSKNQWIGVNTASRFIKGSTNSETLAAENASLKEQLAAAQAQLQLAPAKA